MSKPNTNIEDDLDLPRLTKVLEIMKEQENQKENSEDENDDTNVPQVAQDAYQKANTAQKEILTAGDIEELTDHSDKMDEIYDQAKTWAQDIITAGFNCPPNQQGKVFEAGVQMLNQALSAADSKADKRLRAMRLRLEQARLERDNARDKDKGVIEGEGYVVADRNELIRNFYDSNKKK